jgi:uncharacterized protein YqjF (DUF2071 family)
MQSRVLDQTSHRPWPPPRGPWLQAQTWRDLLFMHWPVDPNALRSALPTQLPIETFDGRAWIAVTPFEVRDLRLHGMPPVPRLSRFAETNVRTYTTVDGKPGIWFFSLDAASLLAVVGARLTYALPYFHARMSIERDADGEIAYATSRIARRAALRTRYRPTGDPFQARPGTLEHFLTERYCLYTVVGGTVRRAEIHHPPWALVPASAEIERNTMAAPLGLDLSADEPLLHFAARQDVVIWAPKRVA